jgi:hypothetical protein
MREEHLRHPHSLSFADLCWYIQEQAFGGLDADTANVLEGLARSAKPRADALRRLKPGIVLVREISGERHTVTVVPGGYVWRETTYTSRPVRPAPSGRPAKHSRRRAGRSISWRRCAGASRKTRNQEPRASHRRRGNRRERHASVPRLSARPVLIHGAT